MGLGGDVAAKKRKVVWDDYTRGFYAESKVESVQRMCDYRAKLTDVINKNEAARCRNAIKQVDAEKQMFLIKKGREAQKHNDTWHDHKAHLNVLEKLAKDREKVFDAEVDNYGRYPPRSTRIDLNNMVETELREMSPVVQRKRNAERLLGKRNEISLIDRTKTTEHIFEELKNTRSRVPSPAKTPVPARKSKSMPKLILPAITVKMTKSGDRAKTVEVSQVRRQNVDESQNKVAKNSGLPPVFVTQFN